MLVSMVGGTCPLNIMCLTDRSAEVQSLVWRECNEQSKLQRAMRSSASASRENSNYVWGPIMIMAVCVSDANGNC